MKKVALFQKVSENIFVSAAKEQGFINPDINAVTIPSRATTGSAGYDFKSPFDFTLKGGETVCVPTGIRIKLKDGFFLAVFPRSGLGFKYKLKLDNTVGIIDGDYYYSDNEGHIMIKMTNCSDKTLEIKKGQGFAQGIILEYFLTSDDDVKTKRNGGFGSTDKK